MPLNKETKPNHIHADVSRNIMTTSMDERTHFFIKIYLSHFILERVAKDVGYVWEVSWRRRETGTYWPQVPLTIAALLPHSTGLLNRGPEGLNPLSVFTPRTSYLHQRLVLELPASNSNWLQLTQAVCSTWLYNCLTSTCLLWAYASAPNSTTSTGQGNILISWTGCTCYLHRCIF